MGGCMCSSSTEKEAKKTFRQSFSERLSKRADDKATQENMLQNLMAETTYSGEQLRKLLKDFKKENPSGRMGAADLQKVFGALFASGDPTAISEQVLRMFDRDNSGYLEFDEVICALSISQKGTPSQKMQLAFDMIDTDNSGAIDKPELLSLVTALHKLVGVTVVHVGAADADTPEKHVDKMWHKLDTNSDGRITFEEFCEGLKMDPAIASLLTSQTKPERLVKQFTQDEVR